MISELNNIKNFLKYDPETGNFEWLQPRGKKIKIGDKAGTKHPDGYVMIRIFGKSYLAHRLAWFYMHGYLPKKFIDHINMNRSDNRAANLRLATNGENMMNQSRRSDNSSGIKGIDWQIKSQRWRARCAVNGIRHTVGFFKSLDEAEKSIREFRQKHHGEFANHGGA